MAFCNIKTKQAQGLANIIAKDVANKRNAGTPYNVEEAMRNVYNLMIENGQDKDRAVTMAALVPKAVIAQVGQYAPNGAYLAPILGKVGELVSKATDFNSVIEVMGLQEEFAEKLNDVEQAQNNEIDVESQPQSVELPKVELVGGIPLVDSGLSTTVLEIGDAEGDPAVKANGEFIRKFIRLGQLQSKNFSEAYVLDKISTYKLALVSSTKIPQESRVKADVYGPVVYAFIDSQGRIVTDENGHTPHAFVRPVEKTEDGYVFRKEKSTSRLQINKTNANNLGLTLEQFEKKIKAEASFLNNAARRISSSPDTIIPLEAVRGTLGVIANAKSVPLKSIPDFQQEFLLPEGIGSGTGRIANVSTLNKDGKVNVYQAFVFQYPGYDYTLQANGLLLRDTEYAPAIKEILLSNDYTPLQKKNLLFNILQKNVLDFADTGVKIPYYGPNSKGIMVVKGKKAIDLSKPEEAAKLVDDYINRAYVNVPIDSNQQYEFDGPVLVSTSSKNKTFLEGEDGTRYEFENVVSKYEVGKIQMVNHIYNNFRVYAPTDSKGNLITPSPVITYKAPIEEALATPEVFQEESVEQIQEELKLLKSEQAEGSASLEDILNQIPEDMPSDMNKVFGRKRTSLDKVDTLSSEATAKQIAEAKAWFESSPLSKVIPVEKWFEIVNSGKVAEFTANAIKLFAGSNYTDLYHEGWHGFSQLFLTKAEKVALYKEVRKLHGNITFLEAEELLAEDFRKYRLSNGTMVMDKSPAKRSIFKKILDFLRALFGNTETKVQYREMVAQEKALQVIKESYDMLYRGEFEERKPNIDNSFFLTLNKGVEGADGKALSAKDSKDISDAMDSIVAGIIRDYSSSPKEVLNKEGALQSLYNTVKFRLRVQLKLASSASKVEDYTKLSKEAKSDFIEQEFKSILDKFEDVGLRDENKSYILSQAEIVLSKPVDKNAYYSLGLALTNFGDTATLKDNAESTMLGYHFKTSRYLESLAKSEDITDLLELDIVDSADDYMSFYDKGGNEVSVKDLADNSVLYAVRSMRQYDKSGKVIKDRFGYDKLADFGKSWNRLSTILRESYSIEDMLDRVNSESFKNKAFQDLQTVLGKNAEAKDDYKFRMQTSFWQAFNKAFVPIYVAYTTTVLSDKGELQQPLSIRVKRAEGEVSSVEKDLTRKFQANKSLPNTSQVNGTRVLNVTKVLEKYKGITAENVVEFYKDMGVLPNELESSTVNFLLSGNILVNTNSMVVNLNKLAASKEADLTTANPINFLSTDQGLFRGMRSTIKNIVEQYGASVGDTGSSRKLTAERTTQFESSLNSRATKIVQLLNGVEKNLDELLNSPATANLHPDNNPAMATNPIMRSLFIMDKEAPGYKSRKTSKNLYLFNVSGMTTDVSVVKYDKNTGADVPISNTIRGTKNISLDEYTKLNQDIHTLFVQGYVENVRASDKSTSLAWKVSGESAYITPADVINKTYLSKATRAVVNMLAGEMATIAKYADAELNVFDAKGNPIKMDSWQIFADVTDNEGNVIKENLLVNPATKAKLNKIIKSGKTDANEIAKEILKEDSGLREEIEKGLRRKIKEELQNLTAVFEKNVELVGKGMAVSKELRSKISQRAALPKDRKTLETAILTAFITETFIRNEAFFSIANGSLASYRSADDTIKRNTTTSTGNLFRSDQAAQAYITAQGRLLEASYSRRTGKPVMPRDYTGVLRTAILKEMTIDGKELNSEWYALAEEAFKADGFSQQEVDSILEAYRSMDEADAQAYITMDTYRQLSIASDEWTQEQEYMYNKLVAGENINNPQQYFPVRKYQYTGPLLNAGAPVQGLHKYSLFPLVPSVIQGTNLEKLNEAMMEAGIDYVTYETGSKAARVGQPVEAFVINKETGERTVPEQTVESFKENVNLIHTDFLRDQLRINSQFKGSATFSTQFRKLLADGIYENGVAKNKELAKANEAFLKNIDDLIAYETALLEKEIDTKDKLVALIKRELERRDVEDYKIEAIDIDKDGNLKYNLDALPAAAEMEKILNGVVNRRLIRAKLKGESLVQVASTGFEKVESSNDLRFYRPGQAAQVKIALQGDFTKLLLMNHPDGDKIGSLERLNALLKDETWVKKNQKLITITGVRIPVQGLNSMELFEVAEFLPPAAGNVIVVPTEMVAKAGSDFDIDKLTMYYPTIFAAKKSKGKKAEILDDKLINNLLEQIGEAPLTQLEASEYTVGLDNNGSSKFKNNIISLARDILLHPDNFTKLIRPIATDLVKENSEAYKELEVSEEDLAKSAVLDYSYNLKKQQENSVGKRALGISAKGNTYNTMFQKLSDGLANEFAYHSDFKAFYGVPFVTLDMADRAYDEKGVSVKYTVFRQSDIAFPFGKIGDLKDSEGKHYKSDIISQIINGHVDVASDSWIFNISADDVTTPYLLNLIDLGVNYDYAVRLLNHPLIREYLDTYKAFKKSELTRAVSPKMMEDYTVIKILLEKHLNEDYVAVAALRDKKTGMIRLGPDGKPMLKTPSTSELFSIVDANKATKTLTVDELKDPSSVKPLMEFMKFVYYSKPLKAVRLSTDVDTGRKAASFIQAASESENIFKLESSPITGPLVTELLSKNVLGTFVDVKNFQMTAFQKLFGFRADPLFMKALNTVVNDTDLAYDKEAREVFVKAKTNGFVSHLIDKINFPYTADNFSKVKSYKGIPVNFVKFEGDLKKNYALSKDGVINIDLAVFQSYVRGTMSKYSLTQNQVYSFLLESEYIKATSNLTGQEALDQALYNIVAPTHLTDFTNPNSVAQKFQEMMADQSAIEALEGYSITDDLIIYDYQGGKMVGIKTDRANVEDMERYHAEIKLLQESTNSLVREFFTRLPEVVMSVEGFKNGPFSLINVVPFDQISRKADLAIREYQALSEEEKQFLINDYLSNEPVAVEDTIVTEEMSEKTIELMTDKEVEEFIKKCKA